MWSWEELSARRNNTLVAQNSSHIAFIVHRFKELWMDPGQQPPHPTSCMQKQYYLNINVVIYNWRNSSLSLNLWSACMCPHYSTHLLFTINLLKKLHKRPHSIKGSNCLHGMFVVMVPNHPCCITGVSLCTKAFFCSGSLRCGEFASVGEKGLKRHSGTSRVTLFTFLAG